MTSRSEPTPQGVRSRREFLVLLTGLAALHACGTDPTPALRAKAREEGAGLDCSDVALLIPVELATRTTNEYVQHTTRDDQFCLNCLNFVPAAAPKTCATCKTVKGPINPDGWCKQWTAQRV